MVKKSKLIKELGIEILDKLKEEQKEIKGNLHPIHLQFKSDEEVSFMEGMLREAEEVYLMLYSLLNDKYNQALKGEKE